MTVAELIVELQKCNPTLPVHKYDSDGIYECKVECVHGICMDKDRKDQETFCDLAEATARIVLGS